MTLTISILLIITIALLRALLVGSGPPNRFFIVGLPPSLGNRQTCRLDRIQSKLTPVQRGITTMGEGDQTGQGQGGTATDNNNGPKNLRAWI